MRRRAAWRLGLVACTLLAGCRTPRESATPAAWERHRQPPALAAYDGAALVDAGAHGWIASVDSPLAAVPRIALRRADWDAHPLSTPVLAELAGTNPSLVLLDPETLGLVYRAVLRDGSCQFLFRRFDVQARRLRPAVRVTRAASAPLAGNGRLLHTSSGTLLFPVVELAQPGVLATASVVLYASRDGGARWERRPLALGPAALAPVVAELPTGALVLVANCLGVLHRAVSTDAGSTWSALESLGIPAQESPHTLWQGPNDSDLLLVWTEAQPHPREVAPPVRALRGAVSADAGGTWAPARTLVARPGWQPRAPALVGDARGLHLAVEISRENERRLLLVGLPRAVFDRAPAMLPARVRDNLRALVAHTLARSEREPYLFVECFLMRTLVAAHAALAPYAAEHVDWLQTERGVALALDYADELVRRQQPSGYWSIGYQSRFVADMAVCVGLFRALSPHVDATRRQQYVGAVTRFVAALERDGLLLANGAVGVGKTEALPQRDDTMPYTVATALAGAVARAWLYTETQEKVYRQGSVASLRWLAGRVAADGSVPGFRQESPLVGAAYMAEAWMAALPLLTPAEAQSLVPTLKRHVQWVLRAQNDDGTWGEPGSGVRERSPLLVNFLVWADRQGLAPPAAGDAIVRALAMLDFDAWRDAGVFAPGAQVGRAMAGVPLVASVQGMSVF